MRYVVTNVRLEETMFRELKLRALERGVPASVVVREALQKYLEEPRLTPAERGRAWKKLLALVGIGRSGSPGKGTGSTDVDDVLYGPRRTPPPKSRKR